MVFKIVFMKNTNLARYWERGGGGGGRIDEVSNKSNPINSNVTKSRKPCTNICKYCSQKNRFSLDLASKSLMMTIGEKLYEMFS